MSELFWNKVAGSVLTTLMAAFGLSELAHVLYHPHALEEPAYIIELPDGEPTAEAPVELGPPDWGAEIPVADLGAGESQSKKCLACHNFEPGGAHALGPNLWNVMGRDAGSIADFGYSGAMLAYAQPWGYQNMYDYLERPQGYIDGTAMAFAGLRKREDRINLIAYMRMQADAPMALPEPMPAEVVEEPDEEDAAENADESAPSEG